MAAPEVGGMLFRGRPSGEPKPAGRLPGRMLGFSEMEVPGRRSRILPPPGAAYFSLAVPERTCRTRGDLTPASMGQFRSDAIDSLGRSSEPVGVILHNGSITKSEARWTLEKALTCRQ